MAEIVIGGEAFPLPPEDTPRGDSQARLQRQLAYLHWCMLPRDERLPGTKKELAKRLGITTQAIHAWDKDPEFQAEVRRRLGRSFKIDRLSTIFEKLYETACEVENPRQVQAARALLEWMDRSQDEGKSPLSEYSDEELERLAEDSD